MKFRPGAVALILVVMFTTVFPLQATAQIQAGSRGLGVACNFLRSLMNSNLGLVVETPGSQNYNIASDNLLAYNALITICKGVYDSVGRTINASIAGHCCNRGYDNMHEATFGVPIRLPVNATNTYNVTDRFPSGSWKVYYENHNQTGFLSDAQYGDVAAYTGLEQEREGNHTAALHETLLLNWMYDGQGIRDDVFRFSNKLEEHGIYQTFKSALYLLALAKTGQNIPSALVSTVQSMQSSDGGFHTGYDANGNYSMTQENVETTSIAMFALVSLPNSCSWFCSYWYLVLIPIGALLLGAGLFYRRIRFRNRFIKPRLALLLLPWPVRFSTLGRTYSTPLFGASLTFGLSFFLTSLLDNNFSPFRNSATSVTVGSFLVVLAWLIIGKSTLASKMERSLMRARFYHPIVGVLSVNSLPKDDFVKVARGPPVMPAEWVEKFHQNGITAELVENLEMSHNHSIIVNPLGESYAEVDFANMTTFQRIRKYIEEGGVFVNVNGLAFYYMWNPSTNVEALTGSPFVTYTSQVVLKARWRKNGKLFLEQGLVPTYVPDAASIVETILFRVFGIRTTVGSAKHLPAEQLDGFQDIVQPGEDINEFRSPLRSENTESVLIPMIRARYQYDPQGRFHECYPIAAVKYGLGYLILLGVAMTEEKYYDLVTRTISVLGRRLSHLGYV